MPFLDIGRGTSGQMLSSHYPAITNIRPYFGAFQLWVTYPFKNPSEVTNTPLVIGHFFDVHLQNIAQ
jgi:hypothetical protein